MFDIPKNQLTSLNDADARELVGRLCEAELSQAGMPVSAVRWSGAQDAADGGLDVDCHVDGGDFHGDFVPRARTGFQVKKPSMPSSKIEKEMSPEGRLRPIFEELARCDGCYIIVSLKDDPTPTGSALADRLEAMRKQVQSLREYGDLELKFYGRGELAQWLRRHPGVQLWVREKLGIPLEGWRPFGRWTGVPVGERNELICRDGVFIEVPGPNAGKYGIEDGIDRTRDLVRADDRAVRIVGLSGVGKTRIAQALFEADVGSDPLDRSLAIYADLGEQPVPSSRQVFERLRAEGLPAVLVLDNCPAGVHRSLAGLAAEAEHVKLITVEYDIREDSSETTSVVQIQAEGVGVAKELVQQRYPSLGQLNAERIAEFSGGNARLAIALAGRVTDHEGLSAFSDRQLFERLFWQGDAQDKELLETAQVLSLVYSFSVSENQDGVDHLCVLAGLVGKNRLSLYRAAHTLVERQLAQKRGHWRAILPHAVANRLAEEALNAIPQESVFRAFEPSQHLLMSFGRRLGYLHKHEVARGIVTSWLKPGGMLHEIENLDGAHVRLLENIAPAAPVNVLDTIEDRLRQLDSSQLPHVQVFQGAIITRLLCAIAYDSKVFERSVLALSRLALSGEANHDKSYAWTRLCGLFSLYLSGTEAPVDVRLPVVHRFLFSSNSDERELGFGMLEAALDGGNRIGIGHFHFGSRLRSLGYWPRSFEEQDDWFRRYLALVAEVTAQDDPALSSRARDLLANRLRNLWGYAGLRPDLAATARRLNRLALWLRGWRATRMILRYDYKDGIAKRGPNGIELLKGLERDLRPTKVADKIRAYVLCVGGDHPSLDDEFDDSDEAKYEASRRRLESVAFSLGEEAADDLTIIDELSGELFSATSGFQMVFGKGLASKSDDIEELWNALIGHLEKVTDDVWNHAVLEGVLESTEVRDKSLAGKLLDRAVHSKKLRQVIVFLQCAVSLDRPAVERLLRSLAFEDIPLHQFGYLAWSRFCDRLPEPDLCEVMSKVLARAGGANVVVNGLGIRFFSLSGEEDRTTTDQLRRIGVRASTQWLQDHAKFGRDRVVEIHNLEKVLNNCIDRCRPGKHLDELMEAFFECQRDPSVSLLEPGKVQRTLAGRQPDLFLDRAIREGEDYELARSWIFREGISEENPLSSIDIADLLAWCRQGDYQNRLAALAEHIFPFFDEMEATGAILSEQARAILDEAEDRAGILSSYARSVQPGMWSGSMADIIARRLPAFESLLDDPRPEVREAARTKLLDIRSWEAEWRRIEEQRDTENVEEHSFE